MIAITPEKMVLIVDGVEYPVEYVLKEEEDV